MMARAALTVTGEDAPDPLTVSAQFLRAPVFGAVSMAVTVRKKATGASGNVAGYDHSCGAGRREDW